MARKSVGSPVERYVAANLSSAHNGKVLALHADARLWLPEFAANAPNAAVFAYHRRLPVVQALEMELRSVNVSNVQLAHSHGVPEDASELLASHAVIRLPADKISFHQLLREAAHHLQVRGTCLVYGGNDEGIKTAARTMQELFGNLLVLAHSGGHRLLSSARTSDLDGEVHHSLAAPYHDRLHFRESKVTLRGVSLTLFSRPGVFSWDHLDEASALLAEVMDIPRGADILDLGCGSGVLGALAGTLSAGGAVTLVDADSEAIRCASRTMASTDIATWRALASDVACAVQGEKFDVVVCNPPFHTGKATDLSLPVRFIEQSHGVLRRGGRLLLVANRTLPYEKEFERVFGNRRTVHDGPRFKVIEGVRQQ